MDKKILNLIKDYWWLLGIGGIFYQTFFLIKYNALQFFSWTQVPADTIQFIFAIIVITIFGSPWMFFESSKGLNKIIEIFVRIIIFGTIFIMLYYFSQSGMINSNLYETLKIILLLSLGTYLMIEVKLLQGTKSPNTAKNIGIFVFSLGTLVWLGNNSYGNVEYENNGVFINISYMNDTYIILETGKIIKNTDNTVLKLKK